MIIDEPDDASDELFTCQSEAHSLLVEFEMLEVTLRQQIKATYMTIAIIAAALAMLGSFVFQQKLFLFGTEGGLLSCGLIIVFGLVFMVATCLKLVGALKNVWVARNFLSRELDEANTNSFRMSGSVPMGREDSW